MQGPVVQQVVMPAAAHVPVIYNPYTCMTVLCDMCHIQHNKLKSEKHAQVTYLRTDIT